MIGDAVTELASASLVTIVARARRSGGTKSSPEYGEDGSITVAWVSLMTMALKLAAGEPEVGPWRTEQPTAVAAWILELGQHRNAGPGPVIVAVDGRSSSGKTTLATRLGEAATGAVVHTDDIAWWHSRFGWADLLIGGILTPARAGLAVSYRPPAWLERQRQGAIEVPAGCPLLIIEGVGAARCEIASLTDVSLWVQSDEQETERRNLARVGQPGDSPTIQHLRDWMAEEVPFLAEQRPWEHVDLITCGTPDIPFDLATELVLAGSTWP